MGLLAWLVARSRGWLVEVTGRSEVRRECGDCVLRSAGTCDLCGLSGRHQLITAHPSCTWI